MGNDVDGERTGSECSVGTESQLGEMGRSGDDGGDGYTACECAGCPPAVCLGMVMCILQFNKQKTQTLLYVQLPEGSKTGRMKCNCQERPTNGTGL